MHSNLMARQLNGTNHSQIEDKSPYDILRVLSIPLFYIIQIIKFNYFY